jgi:hypothetical protein
MNALSVAKLGIGFGARQIAALGMAVAAASVYTDKIKATPVAFDLPGSVVFVPWPKRTPSVNPEDVSNGTPQGFDEMEQALMLFAVASLNS